jgi:cytochrome c-type biogenesis protein CcmH/NrfG
LFRKLSVETQQKYKTAEAALVRALALVPNDINTLDSLGMVYHAQGKFEEAVASFRLAVKLKPGDRHLEHYLKRAEENLNWATKPPGFDKPRRQSQGT